MAEQTELLPTQVADYGLEIQEGGLSRRDFVKGASFAGLGLFSGVRIAASLTDKSPIMMDAKGVLLHNSARCVGCRRCEIACSEWNDGIASPNLARIKISRNLNYGGARKASAAQGTSEGKWGNFRIVADTCKQCPHPVPCAETCPTGAITANAITGARKVDPLKCVGCGICTIACPWALPTVNPATKKSSKCDLCGGKPRCAHTCPTGALTYIAWRDLRLSSPIVQAGWLPATTTTDCSRCHK